jgi:hypothetical protein
VDSYLLFLEENGYLERDHEGRLTPHDWDDLQYESDDSKERVRKFREKKRACNVTCNAIPPLPSRFTSASVSVSESDSAESFANFANEFRACLASRHGLGNPNQDPAIEILITRTCEVCRGTGAPPSVAAMVVADLRKAARFRDKPLEYFLGAVRSQLAGQSGKPLRKAAASAG